MRYRSLTILLLSFIFVGEYNAQDIHLSQFYASDHLLNPAKMGDFEGDFRITGNYRNQWKQINPPVNKGITTLDLTNEQFLISINKYLPLHM